MAKKAIFTASSAFVMSFFRSKKVGTVHRGFVVLDGYADVSPLPKKSFPQLKALSTFSAESLSELIPFIGFTFFGKKALPA